MASTKKKKNGFHHQSSALFKLLRNQNPTLSSNPQNHQITTSFSSPLQKKVFNYSEHSQQKTQFRAVEISTISSHLGCANLLHPHTTRPCTRQSHAASSTPTSNPSPTHHTKRFQFLAFLTKPK
jgi:hypothetical protein